MSMVDKLIETYSGCWKELEVINAIEDVVDCRASMFGNGYYILTDKHIKALKSGKKILFSTVNNEYSLFIAYKE